MRAPDPAVTARLHALGETPGARKVPVETAAAEPAGTPAGAAPEDAAQTWAPPAGLAGYLRASLRARLPAPLQHGRWDPGRRGLVLVAVLGLVAVLVAAVAVARSRARPVPPPAVPAPSGAPAATAGTGTDPLTAGVTVLVDVEGKVRRPGLVTLPAGARIAQAIAAAGGALPGTDTTALDLAQKVSDGEQLRVGEQAAPATGAAPPGGSAGALVNLNTANADQLDALPHVGPATAAKIIDWRTRHGPFTTVSQLEQVPGIGPSTYEDIAPLVTV